MNYGNRREIRIQTPNGERVITPKEVQEMLQRVGTDMRKKYGRHLERMPERPGLYTETGEYIGKFTINF